MQDLRVVIVGAGCFGLSTAYHLLTRGYTNVTVLDRSSVLPAPDASSNDINRVVRTSYSDKFYTELALEAIAKWKNRQFWADTYHESGVLVLGYAKDPSSGRAEDEGQRKGDEAAPEADLTYTDQSFLNDLEIGCNLVPLPDPASIRLALPPDVCTGTFGDDGASRPMKGYINRDCGWADAGQGIRILLSEVNRLGAKIHSGKPVSSIRQENGIATGISCLDGSVYDADLVIIAAGSWTPSAFPDLNLEGKGLATGQSVAMIQLTEEEAELYRDTPVILDFATGFYSFPPTAKNVLKLAIHGPGLIHKTNGGISTPRTILSEPDNGWAIPKESLRELRNGLRKVYPDLARKPFLSTRLCWYHDAPDGDWIIGRHPAAHNLVLATAGSGHAYKFLPVIGRLVADLIEDKLEPALLEKFSLNRLRGRPDPSRSGDTIELDLNQLCSLTDLDAPGGA
ncbi:FAD dependent oxidoreductase [Macrolepiota fuliginosa MF-IS2]|uniref:FAD dependent oxidoreductase n=1 Tax=Macrolepiota fuliginosa MF-IS2 TaxID=1400762 RepID=A0A9P5XJH0_9AGAR|nr:FAD dependent oxidoreductase [Macrolepiota fuliginosa MF-IS2]